MDIVYKIMDIYTYIHTYIHTYLRMYGCTQSLIVTICFSTKLGLQHLSASHQNQTCMAMFAEAMFLLAGRRSLGVGIKIVSTTQATAKNNNSAMDILR